MTTTAGVRVNEPIEIARGANWSRPVLIKNGSGLVAYDLTGKAVKLRVGAEGNATPLLDVDVTIVSAVGGQVLLELTRAETASLAAELHDFHVAVYDDPDDALAKRALYGKILIKAVVGGTL